MYSAAIQWYISPDKDVQSTCKTRKRKGTKENIELEVRKKHWIQYNKKDNVITPRVAPVRLLANETTFMKLPSNEQMWECYHEFYEATDVSVLVV